MMWHERPENVGKMLTHASLFSGIGGAEIAAAWLGWENLFHCDINDFGRKVLGYWFPQSKEYNDIKTTDFTEWRGRVDVLTAGFPCQPFSMAGKRRGADDDRYLWPETLRAINEIRPAWFVGENVFGIASMVLPGEEVDMGRTDDLFEEGNLYRTEQRYVLDRICQDIEDAGYSVQPCVIPACAVGALHRRDRVWFVARRKDDRSFEDTERDGRGDRVPEEQSEKRGQRVSGAGDRGRLRGDTADTQRRGGGEVREDVQPGQPDGQFPHGDGGQRPSAHSARREREALEEMPGVAFGRGRSVPQQGERGDETERTGGLSGVQRADAVSGVAGLQEEGPELKAAGSAGTLPQTDADTDGYGLLGGHGEDEVVSDERGFDAFGDARESRPIPRFQGWENFPTQPPVCRGDDGIPFGVADLALPFGKWRKEAIKALGNAWVPEVAYEIFRMIQEVEYGYDNKGQSALLL